MKKISKMKLHVKISILFAILMLTISSILIYFGYIHLTNVIDHVNKISFDKILTNTTTYLEDDFKKISGEINILSQTILTQPKVTSSQNKKILLLKTALDNNNNVNAAYIGYKDGCLLLIRRLIKLNGYKQYNPPKNSYYVVTTTIPPNQKNSGAVLTFYDKSFNKLTNYHDHNYSYDACTRIWYQQAVKYAKTIISPPYIFYSTKAIGITIAKNNINTNSVIGFDYTLKSLSEMINKYSLSPKTRTILFNSKGQILASNYNNKILYQNNGKYHIPTVNNIVDPVINDYANNKSNINNNNISFYSQQQEWLGKKKIFTLQNNSEQYTVLTVTPKKSLMKKAAEFKNELITAGVLVIIIILPVVWLIALLIARPLIYLSKQLDKIKNFDFKSSIDIKSSVEEIDKLIKSSTNMIQTIKQFQTIAETITKQKKYDTLLNTILQESTSIIKGKGGAVYLFDNNEKELEIAALYIEEKDNTEQNSLFNKLINSGKIPREIFEKKLDNKIDFYTEKYKNHYLNHSLLLWPEKMNDSDLYMSIIRLKDSDNNMMGYIIFAHNKNRNDNTNNSNNKFAFIKALGGFISAAIENQLLIKKRKELLQSLIVLIADAIDAKSPYTGKHCHRVPVLTKMIIEEACKSEKGEYKNYRLNTDQWEEIRIASWLHDCGKVITPADIIDKATKLECIYNRIHEIRMRFELLKSYADKDYWHGLYLGKDKDQLKKELSDKKKTLNNEFAFVAKCNIGGEFMSDKAVEQLQKISKRKWLRTIDDTLGLAEIELTQYENRKPPLNLPVEENLLADKQEHIIKNNTNNTEHEQFGFTMQQPENKRNNGELYNLNIRKGTLTEEDRYIINSHITHTIKMLSALPFPKHMNNIVEIAGNHHERIKGGGYPRGINAEDLPLAARAMAIADIFEALTSHDRPYKKVKTLNEALKIMKFMVNDQHIDKGLFELFIQSGKAEEYAKKYLLIEQQDEINPVDFIN